MKIDTDTLKKQVILHLPYLLFLLVFAGVGPSGPKQPAPLHAGEDIVCAHVKAWGVRFFMKWGRAGAATRCEQKRMKQLMAGGGIALVGATLIPLLSGLFG